MEQLKIKDQIQFSEINVGQKNQRANIKSPIQRALSTSGRYSIS